MENTVEISRFDLKFESYRMKSASRERILLSSISDRGIEEPLCGVCFSPDEREVVLLDGFKRFRCALRLGFPAVPFVSIGRDEATGIMALIRISNAKSLSFIEQAKLVEELKRVYGLSVAEIATHLGRSKALTQKGFKAVHKYLPKLKEDGFGSENFYHDFLVTALHLGNWLVERPDDVLFFTEQELRRCASDVYPPWVPDTNVHRPDGYWGFPKGNDTAAIAIEVELNQKHLSAYEGVGKYYAEQQNIHRVLWMVASPSTIKSIQRKISEVTSTRDKIHNFILEKDFLVHGWHSEIVAGPEAKQSVESFLGHMARRKGVEGPLGSTDRLLLEPRKCYVRSEFYAESSTPPAHQLPTTLYV